MREELMRRLYSIIVNKLYEIFPRKDIKNLFFVGSFATSEQTLLYDKSSKRKIFYVSDLDIIVDVGLLSFIKHLILKTPYKASTIINKVFISLKVNSHVSISLYPLNVARFFHFLGPNTVYIHELTPITEKGLLEIDYLTDLKQHIDLQDTIDLSLSGIADYLLVRFRDVNEISNQMACYILAKRCLSLLYSLLLFSGFRPKGYKESINILNKSFSSLDFLKDIFDPEDVRVLNGLMEYKLCGDLRVLKKVFNSNSIREGDLICFLSSFFNKLASRILNYQLQEYIKFSQLGIPKSESLTKETFKLMVKYIEKKKMSIPKCIFYMLFYSICAITCYRKLSEYKELFKERLCLLWRDRIKMEDYLRCLAGILFLTPIENELIKSRMTIFNRLWLRFMSK